MEARPTTANEAGPPRYPPMKTKSAAALPKVRKARLTWSGGGWVGAAEYFFGLELWVELRLSERVAVRVVVKVDELSGVAEQEGVEKAVVEEEEGRRVWR